MFVPGVACIVFTELVFTSGRLHCAVISIMMGCIGYMCYSIRRLYTMVFYMFPIAVVFSAPMVCFPSMVVHSTMLMWITMHSTMMPTCAMRCHFTTARPLHQGGVQAIDI